MTSFKAGLQNLVRPLSKINSKETSGSTAQWYSSILSAEGNDETSCSLLRLPVPVRLASSGCFQDQLLCASPTLTGAPRAPSVSQALSQLLTLPRPYSVMAPTRSTPRSARSHSDIHLRGYHSARTAATTFKTVAVSQKAHALKKTDPLSGVREP